MDLYYWITALNAATPVPGPTMISGLSVGKVIVPFFNHTGTFVSALEPAKNPEQTPVIYLLNGVSYSVTAIVRSTFILFYSSVA